MEVVTSAQTGVEIQLGLFDSMADLLRISPLFLLGTIPILILLFLIFRRDSSIPKVKTTVFSLMMYYYLCVLLINIVGMPTVREFVRISQRGESIFNPNINLIPLSDGFSLSFILNIFLFIPMGFLCPLISKTFGTLRTTVLIGVVFSLLVEIIQMFTLYRATDINDLLTNVIGTVIGYLCFRLVAKIRIVKMAPESQTGKDHTKYIPAVNIAVAVILGFFS